MKLFLDSAFKDEIPIMADRGILDGVTTNPSLIAKTTGSNYIEVVSGIARQIEKCKLSIPLSIEIFESDFSKMTDQAEKFISNINYKNLNIKVPIGWDELSVIKALKSKNIRVNTTCIFSLSQAHLALDAESDFISIFFCRLSDSGGNPEKVCYELRNIIEKTNSNSQIIAGSIRTPLDIEKALTSGAHICTTALNVYDKSSKHILTTQSVDGFMRDFKAWIK